MQIDSSVLWPLVILILGVTFRKPIGALFGRLNKLIVTRNGFEVEAGRKLEEAAEKSERAAEKSEKAAVKMSQVAEQANNLFHQGKPYDDYSDAFQDAEKKIKDCLSESSTVELKLIAVAMTFSWNFIITKIPKILQQYPTAQIVLDVVFIDPQYLASLKLADSEVNWAEISRQRIIEVQKFAELCKAQFNNRVLITVKCYRNLPHWHGWLVNNDYLFLGRTNWDFPNHSPKLLVGQNKYRYFDKSSGEGSERIQLYTNWHRYYFEFGSDLISDA